MLTFLNEFSKDNTNGVSQRKIIKLHIDISSNKTVIYVQKNYTNQNEVFYEKGLKFSYN